MNKIISSTIYVIFATMLLLSSCDSEGKAFRIQGEVTSAEEKTLYLEHRGWGGVELLDSVKQKKNGKFSFKEKVPQNPEF